MSRLTIQKKFDECVKARLGDKVAEDGRLHHRVYLEFALFLKVAIEYIIFKDNPEAGEIDKAMWKQVKNAIDEKKKEVKGVWKFSDYVDAFYTFYMKKGK